MKADGPRVRDGWVVTLLPPNVGAMTPSCSICHAPATLYSPDAREYYCEEHGCDDCEEVGREEEGKEEC